VRQYGNALLTPVYPVQTGPTPRTTKRGTTAINYAEDGYDDDDFDESDGPRRPTGLRSLRREESTGGMLAPLEKLGKEVHAPVEVQGVFREWMIKRMLRPAYVPTTSSRYLRDTSWLFLCSDPHANVECDCAGVRTNYKSKRSSR
jgi:hypothetical protein